MFKRLHKKSPKLHTNLKKSSIEISLYDNEPFTKGSRFECWLVHRTNNCLYIKQMSFVNKAPPAIFCLFFFSNIALSAIIKIFLIVESIMRRQRWQQLIDEIKRMIQQIKYKIDEFRIRSFFYFCMKLIACRLQL